MPKRFDVPSSEGFAPDMVVAHIRRQTQILFSMFQIFITLCTSRQSYAICFTMKVSRHIKWLIDN